MHQDKDKRCANKLGQEQKLHDGIILHWIGSLSYPLDQEYDSFTENIVESHNEDWD